MNNEDDEKMPLGWRMFLRRHSAVTALFIIAAIVLLVLSVYVFYWFSGDAQATDLVPTVLGLWSIGDLVWFLLWLVFWELVFIGIPAAALAIFGWLWWRRLPYDEKEMFNPFNGDSRSMDGSWVSFLLFIGFVLKVYIDGNWDVSISTWTLDYVVDSIITVLMWGALIAAVPLTILTIIWIVKPEALED